jgi:hypothetical protein
MPPTEKAAEQMAWFVHYWDEINNRNICSNEIGFERQFNGPFAITAVVLLFPAPSASPEDADPAIVGEFADV